MGQVLNIASAYRRSGITPLVPFAFEFGKFLRRKHAFCERDAAYEWQLHDGHISEGEETALASAQCGQPQDVRLETFECPTVEEWPDAAPDGSVGLRGLRTEPGNQGLWPR
jgi:hypothetical protein